MSGRKIEWASAEFDELWTIGEHQRKIEEEMQMISEVIGQIETPEGGRHLIGVITGH